MKMASPAKKSASEAEILASIGKDLPKTGVYNEAEAQAHHFEKWQLFQRKLIGTGDFQSKNPGHLPLSKLLHSAHNWKCWEVTVPKTTDMPETVYYVFLNVHRPIAANISLSMCQDLPCSGYIHIPKKGMVFPETKADAVETVATRLADALAEPDNKNSSKSFGMMINDLSGVIDAWNAAIGKALKKTGNDPKPRDPWASTHRHAIGTAPSVPQVKVEYDPEIVASGILDVYREDLIGKLTPGSADGREKLQEATRLASKSIDYLAGKVQASEKKKFLERVGDISEAGNAGKSREQTSLARQITLSFTAKKAFDARIARLDSLFKDMKGDASSTSVPPPPPEAQAPAASSSMSAPLAAAASSTTTKKKSAKTSKKSPAAAAAAQPVVVPKALPAGSSVRHVAAGSDDEENEFGESLTEGVDMQRVKKAAKDQPSKKRKSDKRVIGDSDDEIDLASEDDEDDGPGVAPPKKGDHHLGQSPARKAGSGQVSSSSSSSAGPVAAKPKEAASSSGGGGKEDDMNILSALNILYLIMGLEEEDERDETRDRIIVGNKRKGDPGLPNFKNFIRHILATGHSKYRFTRISRGFYKDHEKGANATENQAFWEYTSHPEMKNFIEIFGEPSGEPAVWIEPAAGFREKLEKFLEAYPVYDPNSPSPLPETPPPDTQTDDEEINAIGNQMIDLLEGETDKLGKWMVLWRKDTPLAIEEAKKALKGKGEFAPAKEKVVFQRVDPDVEQALSRGKFAKDGYRYYVQDEDTINMSDEAVKKVNAHIKKVMSGQDEGAKKTLVKSLALFYTDDDRDGLKNVFGPVLGGGEVSGDGDDFYYADDQDQESDDDDSPPRATNASHRIPAETMSSAQGGGDDDSDEDSDGDDEDSEATEDEELVDLTKVARSPFFKDFADGDKEGFEQKKSGKIMINPRNKKYFKDFDREYFSKIANYKHNGKPMRVEDRWWDLTLETREFSVSSAGRQYNQPGEWTCGPYDDRVIAADLTCVVIKDDKPGLGRVIEQCRSFVGWERTEDEEKAYPAPYDPFKPSGEYGKEELVIDYDKWLQDKTVEWCIHKAVARMIYSMMDAFRKLQKDEKPWTIEGAIQHGTRMAWQSIANYISTLLSQDNFTKDQTKRVQKKFIEKLIQETRQRFFEYNMILRHYWYAGGTIGTDPKAPKSMPRIPRVLYESAYKPRTQASSSAAAQEDDFEESGGGSQLSFNDSDLVDHQARIMKTGKYAKKKGKR